MGDNTYPELTLETWMYRLCGVDVGMYCQKHPRLLHLFYNIHTIVFIPIANSTMGTSSPGHFEHEKIQSPYH